MWFWLLVICGYRDVAYLSDAIHLNRSTVIWIVISNVTIQIHESQTMTWRNQTLKLRRQKPFLLLRSLLIASKQPHNFLCSCVTRCLFQSVFSYTVIPCSCGPGPLFQLYSRHVRFLRPRLRFHRFFSGALLSNFNMIVRREFLIMWGQQLVDVFSIVGTNLFTWLITHVKSGGNDERRTGLGWRITVLTGEHWSTRDDSPSQRHLVRHSSLPYIRTIGLVG
jgi:hypothetical protein